MAFMERNLMVKKSTIPGAGKGLFTKIFIPKGSRIAEYKGKITSWKDVDDNNGLNAYIYYVNRHHVIDSSKQKKNLARYVNDAKGSLNGVKVTNNCKYVIEDCRVFLESKKNIPPKSELLVGYGKEYWDIIRYNKKQAALKKRKPQKSSKNKI
jgi:uncharacterized protein